MEEVYRYQYSLEISNHYQSGLSLFDKLFVAYSIENESI